MKSFNMYHSYRTAFERMDGAQCKALVLALFDHCAGKKTDEMDAAVDMAFCFMAAQMDRDAAAYDAKCARNRQIAQEREAARRTVTNVHARAPDKDRDEDSDEDGEKDGGKKKGPPGGGRQKGGKNKRMFGDFVSMTDEEHAQLAAKLGEGGAVRCVEILDNYKGASGRQYKSDYRAILSWVVERWRQEGAQDAPGGKEQGASRMLREDI